MNSSKPKDPGLPLVPGYAIEREVGRGASGVVYRARQVSVDRLVALKVMHAGLGTNTRSIRRLQREARIAAHLGHPSLISAIDMGESEGHWWFAMEFVEGPTLAERLEKGGRLMEREALVIFEQLCDALQHASEKGVVHRDIKPANILLERPDFPRLVDLGLARIEDDPMLTRTGSTLGTPHYISPEQARDPALADVRSDIWSLGATLYHAVCGRPPFAGESTAEILSSVLYGPIPDPSELRPELSRGLALILRKCLSRDPDRRYFAPAELGDDLARVREHKAPQIRRAALEPLDPTVRRHPQVTLAWIVGLVAVLVGLLVWAPWRSAPDRSDPAGTNERQGPWPPLAQFDRDLESGSGSLASAFADLAELEERVPTEERAHWERVHGDLKRRLQAELSSFWEGRRTLLDGSLEARDFDSVQQQLDVGLASDLFEQTGFTPASLPRDLDRSSFRRRSEAYRERLDNGRRVVLVGAVAAVERHVRNQLLPAIERDRQEGNWSAARAKLNADWEELCRESNADLRGVREEALVAALSPLTGGLGERLQALELDWHQLDGVQLLTTVQTLGDRAERALAGEDVASVLDDFERNFDQALFDAQLDRETLALAPSHESLDAFRARHAVLEDLADEIIQRRAGDRLAVLDKISRNFYLNRDYEGAVALWQSIQGEPVLTVVEGAVAIRLEGAQELLAFLRRAAAGIHRLEGQRVTLPQGSIRVTGEVQLSGKALERGFRLVISRSSSRDYILRSNRVLGGEVLDPRSLERFAIEGADLESDIGLQLQRALFRYHEGDFEGAHDLLSGEGLQGGDLILYDLGLRVSKELGREQEVLERRKQHAEREVDRLTSEDAETLRPKQRALQIGRLLREYKDVLDDTTEAILLRIRASLLHVLPPSSLKDFEGRFGPTLVSFPTFGRVRMSFRFDKNLVGAWDRGEWYFTGDQAWVGLPSGSSIELERRPSPSLDLPDPLLTATRALEVSVRFFQPKDSPPELFAVSLLGFHAVFIGETLTEPARILSGTTGLVKVVNRARLGEGREFSGFKIETEHLIKLRVSRGSGKILVWLDGVRIDDRDHHPPGDGADRARLRICAIEPIELREVIVEGDRR